MCMSRVNYVIYHRFSHGAPFYKLNGENIVMLIHGKEKGLIIGYCKIFKWTLLKQASPKLNVYMQPYNGTECTHLALAMRFFTNFHTALLPVCSVGDG